MISRMLTGGLARGAIFSRATLAALTLLGAACASSLPGARSAAKASPASASAKKPPTTTGTAGTLGQTVPGAPFAITARVTDVNAAPTASSTTTTVIASRPPINAMALAQAANQTQTRPNNAAPRPRISAAAAERSVGTIRMVNASQRFVLIETPWNAANLALTDNQELLCRIPAAQGGGQSALVRVGRERRQQFLVADVVSGQPHIGDLVFLVPDRVTSNVRVGAAATAPAPSAAAPLFPSLVPDYAAPANASSAAAPAHP